MIDRAALIEAAAHAIVSREVTNYDTADPVEEFARDDVSAALPVIVGAVTDELRPFAQGKAIWAHALGSDAEQGWLDLIHMLNAIDQTAGRETTA